MQTFPIAITALVLELLYWQLAQVNVRADDVPLAIRHMMLVSLVYLVSAGLALYRKGLMSKGFILGAAIAFRLTMLPVAPGLSDDVFRYRWEGRVQSEGRNPYLVAPQEVDRDPTYARTPTQHARSGYGPVATLLEWAAFEGARRWSDDPFEQASWMKTPAVVFEAATLLLLAAILPAPMLLIYAWAPLPIVELWWSGHNDALAVFWMTAALVLGRSERWGPAQLALGLAIASKWWPGLLWPLFAVRQPRRAWIAPLVVLLSALPYLMTPQWRDLVTNARYMSGYLGGWRNNDSLFGVLLWVAGGDAYRAKYAAFAMVGGVVAWVMWRRWPLERAALAAVAALLLLSANCHPWYLTWLVPLAALAMPPGALLWPLLVWTALMPLSYRVLESWYGSGVWDGSRPDRWWIYGPTAVSAILSYYVFRGPLANSGAAVLRHDHQLSGPHPAGLPVAGDPPGDAHQ